MFTDGFGLGFSKGYPPLVLVVWAVWCPALLLGPVIVGTRFVQSFPCSDSLDSLDRPFLEKAVSSGVAGRCWTGLDRSTSKWKSLLLQTFRTPLGTLASWVVYSTRADGLHQWA